MPLSIRDQMRIRLADENRGTWAQRAGRIRWELGESETAMWVRVGQLLEDSEAIAAFPMETARLRRRIEAQRGARRGGYVVPTHSTLDTVGGVRS